MSVRRRYLLSQHPAAEAKVADELDEAGLLARPGSPEPRQLQYDDISRLPYLGCVIKVCSWGYRRIVLVAGRAGHRITDASCCLLHKPV